MPKISAIITTWNRSQQLRRALESVLDQTHDDFELLILDNGSTDNTEEMIREYHDPRIRYIRHNPCNIAAARNIGIHESKGIYLAFLDDDDEWLSHKLVQQCAVFDGDHRGVIGLVYGGYRHINEHTKKIFEIIYPKRRGNVYDYAVKHRDTLTGSASNPLLRKDAVIQVGRYDETIKTGEDYEMFLRLAKKYEFQIVENPVVNIYVHNGYRLSYQLKDYLHTELTVYKKHHETIAKDKKTHVYYLQVIAGKCLRLGLQKEARIYLRRAMGIDILRGGVYVQWTLSFLPTYFYKSIHRVILTGSQFIRRYF